MQFCAGTTARSLFRAVSILGIAGRDRDVPELSKNVPYDPFKVDIFTIGNVLLRAELQAVRFHSLDDTLVSYLCRITVI